MMKMQINMSIKPHQSLPNLHDERSLRYSSSAESMNVRSIKADLWLG